MRYIMNTRSNGPFSLALLLTVSLAALSPELVHAQDVQGDYQKSAVLAQNLMKDSACSFSPESGNKVDTLIASANANFNSENASNMYVDLASELNNSVKRDIYTVTFPCVVKATHISQDLIIKAKSIIENSALSVAGFQN
jgi:hypothetical protein